jgi:glutathione S-transferase
VCHGAGHLQAFGIVRLLSHRHVTATASIPVRCSKRRSTCVLSGGSISSDTLNVVTMWERRAELDGFAAVMEGVRNAIAGLKGRALSGPHAYEQIPELIERSKQRMANFYADFDERLASVPFVAGEEFSAADITTLVTVDFATNALNMPIPDKYTAFQKWYDKTSSRPAASA